MVLRAAPEALDTSGAVLEQDPEGLYEEPDAVAPEEPEAANTDWSSSSSFPATQGKPRCIFPLLS